MQEIHTAKRTIGPNHPTYIIAEMAWSHDGAMEKASAIIRGAAQAGADAIGVHITSMPDYMVPHYGNGQGRVSAGKESQNIYRYLERINLPFDAWAELISLAKKLGLDVCIMANDESSLQFALHQEPDMLVISPASFVEEDFVRTLARSQKPLIVRIGGALWGEIEKVIFWAQGEGNTRMILLFGFQNYPTPIEGTHLEQLRTVKKAFGFQVGLADHLDAEDELALYLPLLAIPLGATVIEKHVTHDRRLKGEDFESALNPDELGRMVSAARRVEKAMGSAHIQAVYPTMDAYRQISRKRLVAARELKKGEVLSREKIICKRSDEGLAPDEIRYVLGRKAKKKLAVNDPITLESIG